MHLSRGFLLRENRCVQRAATSPGSPYPLAASHARPNCTPHTSAMVAGLVILMLPFAQACAQQIFKSVDADGHVVYSNEADPAATQTPVELPVDGPSLPDTLHFCWTNCFTLVLTNGVYQRSDGTPESWTVERFAPEAVILHRHDAPAGWNGNRIDVRYEGVIIDGHLRDITVNGRPVPAIDIAWGEALNSVPGSNAERDQRNWAPSPTQAYAPSGQRPPGIDWDGVGEITATQAPPPLQEEEQPENALDGYLWTPGYWFWVRERHCWIPGAWVRPPRLGLLWTPGYWAYVGGVYTFYPGYWGPHVGFYGGINYGYGYYGAGFTGGRWTGNTFAYNSSVSRLSPAVHNTYSEPAVRPLTAARISFNGGPGGTTARPTPQEQLARGEQHLPITPQQRQTLQVAAGGAPAGKQNMAIHANTGPGAGPKISLSRESALPQPRASAAPTAPGRDTPPAQPAGQAPLPVVATEPEAAKKSGEARSSRAKRP